MISQNKKKLLRSLASKKHRNESGLFVAEGRKVVGDLIRGGLTPTYVAATEERMDELAPWLGNAETAICSADELTEVSDLKTRTELIAVLRKPAAPSLDRLTQHSLVLALDEVQDPGNLGTIARTADWFGLRTIVCSRTCADAFGPKAVQASMGALCRTNFVYTDLRQWLDKERQDNQTPVFGTFLEGENIYEAQLPQRGIVVMGNEGRGISDDIAKMVNRRLYIPNYPASEPTSESLNVGIATAIALSEFRRRTK